MTTEHNEGGQQMTPVKKQTFSKGPDSKKLKKDQRIDNPCFEVVYSIPHSWSWRVGGVHSRQIFLGRNQY